MDVPFDGIQRKDRSITIDIDEVAIEVFLGNRCDEDLTDALPQPVIVIRDACFIGQGTDSAIDPENRISSLDLPLERHRLVAVSLSSSGRTRRPNIL